MSKSQLPKSQPLKPYSKDEITKILRQRKLENCFIGGDYDSELATNQRQFFEDAVKTKNKFAILPLNLGEQHWVLCFFIFDNEEKTFEMLYFDPLSNEEKRQGDIAKIIGNAVLPSGFVMKKASDISVPIEIANCGLILIETAEIIIGYFGGKGLAQDGSVNQDISDDCRAITKKIGERFFDEAVIGVIRFGHKVALSDYLTSSAAPKRKRVYKAAAAIDGVGADVDSAASKDIAAATLLEMSVPAAEITKYSDDKAVPMLSDEDEVVAKELMKIKDVYAAKALMSFKEGDQEGVGRYQKVQAPAIRASYTKAISALSTTDIRCLSTTVASTAIRDLATTAN